MPQLRAALLTVANLPAMGFQRVPTNSASASDPDALRDCPFATAGQNPGKAATVAFSVGLSEPDLTEGLLLYPVSGAKKQMAQFAQLASKCSSFPVTVEGVVIRVDIARKRFPVFGRDGTIALRITYDVIRYHNMTIASDVVAVRHGGTLMVLTNSAQALDPALTVSAVREAYAKLARLP